MNSKLAMSFGFFGEDGPVQVTICRDKDDNDGVYLVKEHTPEGWHIGVRTVFSDYERCMLEYLNDKLNAFIVNEEAELRVLVNAHAALEEKIGRLEADYNLLKTYMGKLSDVILTGIF